MKRQAVAELVARDVREQRGRCETAREQLLSYLGFDAEAIAADSPGLLRKIEHQLGLPPSAATQVHTVIHA